MKSRNEFTTNEEYNEYLRIYFAGLAMQGLLALPYKGTYSSLDEGIERICKFSIKFADELLKQLENK